MHKSDVDRIVNELIEEGWNGEKHKDFAEKLGDGYSYGQIERVRGRYRYITSQNAAKKE